MSVTENDMGTKYSVIMFIHVIHVIYQFLNDVITNLICYLKWPLSPCFLEVLLHQDGPSWISEPSSVLLFTITIITLEEPINQSHEKHKAHHGP